MNGKFVEILRNHLKYLPAGQELMPDDRLRELGLDSMSAMALLLDLEDTFHLSLDDDSMVAGTFRTAATLWQAIERVRGQGLDPDQTTA